MADPSAEAVKVESSSTCRIPTRNAVKKSGEESVLSEGDMRWREKDVLFIA